MSRNKPKSKVRTAKGRKSGSTRWLQRQLNDPYVAEAERLGYRSRAAFKLKEIDEKLGLLKSGMSVVDLGAAPGGHPADCWEEFSWAGIYLVSVDRGTGRDHSATIR